MTTCRGQRNAGWVSTEAVGDAGNEGDAAGDNGQHDGKGREAAPGHDLEPGSRWIRIVIIPAEVHVDQEDGSRENPVEEDGGDKQRDAIGVRKSEPVCRSLLSTGNGNT